MSNKQVDSFGAHGLTKMEIDADDTWVMTGWIPAEGQQIAICDRCGTMLGHPCAATNAAGIKITVGADCLERILLAHGSDRAKASLANVHNQVKKAAKARREARREIERADNRQTFAVVIARCESLKQNASGFAHSFACSLISQINHGSKPSEKQMKLLVKLEEENPPVALKAYICAK